LLVLTAACAATAAPPGVPVRASGQLVTQVPDSLFDAGRGASAALDADGNPVVSYVLLKPTLKEDELPPPVIAGDPQPPAIMIAAQKDGAWTRTSVTEQSTNPAEGKAVGISNEEGTAGPAVNTSLKLDGQGARHVAWSSTDGVFYASDSGGSFGEPEQIGSGTTTGASLALGSDGSPWISFYKGDEVHMAHREGNSWTVEDVASNLAVEDQPGRTTAVAVTADGQPVVAFGRAEGTVVASRDGDGAWSLESVPGAGGYGVSLAVDGEGNLHLAYYDPSGGVHHAERISGSPWTVSDVAAATGASSPDGTWGTGIDLDDQGTQYVVYTDPAAHEVALATNEGGEFEAAPIPNGESGATPSMDISGDGRDAAIAFFDTANADLEVATAPEGGLHLAFSPPAATAGPTAEPPPTEAPCQPEGTQLEITAQNISFDKDCLAAPADTPFEIHFTNDEPPGIPHNVHLYTDESATESLGGAQGIQDTIEGGQSTTYQVDPIEAGNYYFHCDVHPTMNGTFVSA
jgi:plastocyanin